MQCDVTVATLAASLLVPEPLRFGPAKRQATREVQGLVFQDFETRVYGLGFKGLGFGV